MSWKHEILTLIRIVLCKMNHWINYFLLMIERWMEMSLNGEWMVTDVGGGVIKTCLNMIRITKCEK